jgi:hypothetical protein
MNFYRLRKCYVCSSILPINNNFYCCSICGPIIRKIIQREYQRKNYSKVKIWIKRWQIKNKEKVKNYALAYSKKNSYKYQKIYIKNKMQEDTQFKLQFYIRKSLTDAFRKRSIVKVGSNNKYGIDFKKIVKYLIRTMPKDFNERKYHIDHIRPLCSFDLNDPNQVREAFEVSNLRWLLAHDNISKGGKIESLINF